MIAHVQVGEPLVDRVYVLHDSDIAQEKVRVNIKCLSQQHVDDWVYRYARILREQLLQLLNRHAVVCAGGYIVKRERSAFFVEARA